MAGEQGEPVLQEVEGGSISVLSPLGLTRDSLTVGERVTVRALPHRGGPGRSVLGLDAVKADGSVVPLNVSAARVRPPSDAVASSIAGRWAPPAAAFLELDTDAPTFPMTEKGGRRSQETASRPTACRRRPQLMQLSPLFNVATCREDSRLHPRLDGRAARRGIST